MTCMIPDPLLRRNEQHSKQIHSVCIQGTWGHQTSTSEKGPAMLYANLFTRGWEQNTFFEAPQSFLQGKSGLLCFVLISCTAGPHPSTQALKYARLPGVWQKQTTHSHIFRSSAQTFLTINFKQCLNEVQVFGTETNWPVVIWCWAVHRKYSPDVR